ncbi:cupin domain-containing protein [Streptomyces sp. B1866]|uniref:cupin domain-containing protein n=1 Tax=Streptomyces sp. B1866 TaxID=3075431 RepID=UPI002891D837|nr:cupin domain-containing protein [Streptomyces sp. B1866]MDT3395484.1 cupin domain-containing protein [Streptomyces sp. B1866]
MDDLTALARRHLDQARIDPHGRSSHLFLRDGPLRQSVIALTSGQELDEHNAPPAASIQVLHGHVRLTGASGETQELIAGQVLPIPHERHGLRAVEDSVVLLTAVTATTDCLLEADREERATAAAR